MLKAMLAPNESIKPKDVEQYITNDNWWAEPKLDGHRVIVVVKDGRPTCLNRDGEIFKNRIPAQSLEDFTGGQWGDGTWIFDCEYMADVDHHFYVFDFLETPNGSLLEKSYAERRIQLSALFTQWTPFTVHLVPSTVTPDGKRDLLAKIEAAGGEGVMFKDKNARYSPGKRSTNNLKYKLWKDVDCVVSETYREGKRSIGLEIYDANGASIDIGSCTMSDRNLLRVKEGDVVTIKYLYCGAGMRLFQPAFIRIRRDKAPSECTTDQLKHVNKVPVF